MISRRHLSAILATGAVFRALPALAAEAPDQGGGLPQFDTALFPEQLFWLAISFALLYGLMAYIALPTVRRTQDKRSDVISAELAAAQKANDEAKAMMAQYEKALIDARAEAQATVNEISTQAAKEAAARQTVQQQTLAKRLSEAGAQIATARDSAVKEVRATALGLAEMIVEKVMGLKASPVRSASDR